MVELIVPFEEVGWRSRDDEVLGGEVRGLSRRVEMRARITDGIHILARLTLSNLDRQLTTCYLHANISRAIDRK
jgi:hypothetical protein